jgi:hypothetical protein
MMNRDELIEEAAEKIFLHWHFQKDHPMSPVAWVKGENSLEQDEARAFARAALGREG